MNNFYILCLKLYDNEGNEILLSRYNTHNVKYAYYDEELNWVKSTDYNYEPQLNVLWVRFPYSAYQNKFLLNVAVNTEEVFTSGVIDVDWTNLPNPTPISLTMVSTIDDNAQGFAPRIIKHEGQNYWYEYSQEYGGLYNTNIPVVSELATQGTIDITSDDNTIGISKKVDTQNDKITYDLSVSGLTKLDQLKMVQPKEIVTLEDGTTLGYGDTYYLNADGTKDLKGKANHHQFYSQSVYRVTEDGKVYDWWEIMNFQKPFQAYVTFTINGTNRGGMIYCIKDGYTFKAVTTSKDIASNFKTYTNSINSGSLYISATYMQSKSYTIEVFEEPNNSNTYVGKVNKNYNFKTDRLTDIPYFITNDEFGAFTDYITIDTPTYFQRLDDLQITNFNIGQDVLFILDQVPQEQLSLRFITQTEGSKVTIRIGGNEYVSNNLIVGQQAVFSYADEDTNGFTYTNIENFNDLLYNSGYTQDTHVLFENIVRKGDGKVVFDLNDFNKNWETINNNFTQLNESVVKAVTINNETHYPTSGIVDLGTIGGGGSNVSFDNTTKILNIDGSAYQMAKSVKINGNTTNFDTNGVADLGTMKVKSGNDIFSADTANTINIGVFDRPNNAKLKTANSGWVKLSGNNSWFDITIRLYESEVRVGSYDNNSGIRVIYHDGGNRLPIFIDKSGNTQNLYLYYGGNTNYFLKVNQGQINVTDTEDVVHTIYSYSEEDSNQISVKLESVDTNTLFQLVGFSNNYGINDTAESTIRQSYIDYCGHYEVNSKQDSVVILQEPSYFKNDFSRLVSVYNTNSAHSISVTFKKTDGNVIKRMEVMPTTTARTTIEYIGNYTTTNKSGWNCDCNEYNGVNAEFGANQLFQITASSSSQFEFRLKGQKVEMECDDGGNLFVMNESKNNADITILLTDIEANTALVSALGGLQLFVKKGSVTYTDNYTSNDVVVTSSTRRERVVWARVESYTTIAPYQAVCGNSGYLPSGASSSTYPNAYRYRRSGGSLTSINVWVNPPLCKRQKFSVIETLYTTSTASSWSAFLFGKDSSNNNYQISRTHTYETTYGKEVAYPITWDVKLQKYVLGEY